MRLKLLSCAIAVIIALSATISATYALFSDIESVSFTMSAASLEMSLSKIDTGCIPPVMHVTVTNNGTINADLWLANIYRQQNATAESELMIQFGIDIRDFFKDVTLEVSYNNIVNNFSIQDLDNPSAPILLMGGITPRDSVAVTIRQNLGSIITLNESKETVEVDTDRTLPDIEIFKESTVISTEISEAEEEIAVLSENTEQNELQGEDVAKTEPSIKPILKDIVIPELYAELLSEDESETEQSSELLTQDEDSVELLDSESVEVEKTFGHYERRNVYVPYVFEFMLRSSTFTSMTEKTGFTIIKLLNIYVTSIQPEAMMSELDETDEIITDNDDETTTNSTVNISKEASGQTIEDITITSETQTTTVQDAKGEPERERFIEPATEPSSEQFINPFMEIKPTDEPEELPTEPALDVSEPLDDHDDE